MSTVTIKPFLRYSRSEKPLYSRRTKILKPSSLNFSTKFVSNGASTSFCNFKPPRSRTIRASSIDTALVETFKSSNVFFKETFPLARTDTVEGKIFVRLDKEKGQQCWQLSIGCSLPGKWILHWGVSYADDFGSEWDQPPKNMRPPGSVPIKDYAIETPLKKSLEGDMFHEVKIDLDPKSSIKCINFVLKDEENGAWYQHRGIDFKVPLVDYLLDNGNVVGAKRGFSIWPGCRNHCLIQFMFF